MYMKTSIISFIFIFLQFYLFAEVIKNIEISEIKEFDETIKVYGKLKTNTNYNDEDYNKVLKNLYDTGFFEEVSLSKENSTLKIFVKEYPTINQLVILGVESNKQKEQIKKTILSKENGTFIKSNLEKDLNTIKNYFHLSGIILEIDTKVKKIDDLNLDLIVEIKKEIFLEFLQ